MKDYDRGTEHFRGHRPNIEEFEPWRAILASQLKENLGSNQNTSIEAVKILAQVDPSFATRLDNSIRRLIFTFKADLDGLSESDPKRYVQLVYNQDAIVDIVMSDFRLAAKKLASRVSIFQWLRVVGYLRSIEKGTKEFHESMEKQSEMLKKVINP